MVVGEHLARQRLVEPAQRLDRLEHVGLGAAAHEQQLLLEFLEIPFEMSFHACLVWEAPDQPKRPVM